MSNIDITLLTSKRTSLSVDGLATSVVYQQGGYRVIAGEGNATTIRVHYPPTYGGQHAYVYMRNAKGEYATQDFGELDSTTKEFRLPASMTFAGNTFLVFHADDGDGDGQIKTVWERVVIPIAATGEDYQAVAMASPDVLAQAIAVAAAAENGDLDGKSVFVRFADNASGTGMTATWSSTMKYMGVYTGQAASTNPTDYTWTLFCGQAVIEDDSSVTSIDYTLVDNVDKTFQASGITAIKIRVPATIAHGFYAGVNVVCGSSTPTFEIVNGSSKPTKVVIRGMLADSYTPRANTVNNMLIYCDGYAVYFYINEVAK